MQSIGKALDSSEGYGPGFDFLRVSLALAIVCLHAFTVTDQFFPGGEDTPFWFVHYALVPMFFALSGFLVTASANRLALDKFLLSRGLRIVPALAVDTVVCALVIGPLVTTATLDDYFFNRTFLTYFLNMVGWVHYSLPGVFENLPVARVNGSLWTVPFELACYAIISLMMVTGLIRTKYVIPSCIVAYIVVSSLFSHLSVLEQIGHPIVRRIASVAFIEHEAQAVTAFLCGIVAYQHRYAIPHSRALVVACLLVGAALAFGLNGSQGNLPGMRIVILPVLTYVTVFTGCTRMWLPPFFRTGDYSYGIYLYHQPFLQIAVLLFPAIAFHSHAGALFVFLAALPFILMTAVLSWHVVEKPTLALRKVIFAPKQKSAARSPAAESVTLDVSSAARSL